MHIAHAQEYTHTCHAHTINTCIFTQHAMHTPHTHTHKYTHTTCQAHTISTDIFKRIEELGWCDGLVSEDVCHETCPEFNLWDQHGRSRDSFPTSCLLTSISTPRGYRTLSHTQRGGERETSVCRLLCMSTRNNAQTVAENARWNSPCIVHSLHLAGRRELELWGRRDTTGIEDSGPQPQMPERPQI